MMAIVGLHHLYAVDVVDLEDWLEFFEDMCVGVSKECRDHGEFVRRWVDQTATPGCCGDSFVEGFKHVAENAEADIENANEEAGILIQHRHTHLSNLAPAPLLFGYMVERILTQCG